VQPCGAPDTADPPLGAYGQTTRQPAVAAGPGQITAAVYSTFILHSNHLLRGGGTDEARAGGEDGRLNGGPNVAQVAPHAEDIEQPKDHHHDDHNIEDLFDLPIHREVGVDEPEQDSDDNERDDN